MTSLGLYRRHSAPFKLQLCQDIRAGVIGRRDAMPRCVDTRSPSVSPGPSAKRIATS